MSRAVVFLVTLFVAGCASTPPRFTDEPPVSREPDPVDIAEPAENEFHRFAHHIENFGTRQARLGLDPVPPRPALDVNRFGEVLDSTWWQDRGPLTPDDVARGHGGVDPGPEAFFPWTITRAKVGGANPGFNFTDARGVRYLLKVDKIGEPIVATAAGAVANRLFWALGYNTPDDRVVEFDRDQLLLDEKARSRGVTEEQVDAVLERFATALGPGRYRALSSRFLDGKPVGGFSYTGVREDDPNDRIPHERRRSLRALRVFGAWLNHVDMKVDNTLDLYTERDGVHLLEHYLVDFDGCLGGYWAARHEARIGWARDVDLGEIVTGLFSFALTDRPYEHLGDPVHPELGLIEAQLYDPARFRANYANDYVQSAQPADLFWGGLRLARITREHIAAAVRTGRYRDPQAERLLVDLLERRRVKTVDWALRQVTPVVELEPDPGTSMLRVDAKDALRTHGLPSDLRYDMEITDASGRPIPDLGGSGLGVSLDVDQDDVVVRWIATDATGRRLPPTDAHYRRRAGAWHLVGVLRDGQ